MALSPAHCFLEDAYHPWEVFFEADRQLATHLPGVIKLIILSYIPKGIEAGANVTQEPCRDRIMHCAAVDAALAVQDSYDADMSLVTEGKTVMKLHVQEIACIASLPDSTPARVLIGCKDGTLQLCTVMEHGQSRMAKPIRSIPTAILVLPGNRAIVNYCDYLMLWDLKTHARISSYKRETPLGPTATMALLPNGRFLLGDDTGVVQMISPDALDTAIRTFTSHTMGITAICVIDDSTFACGTNDGKITIWDMSTGKMLRFMRAHNHRITSLVLGLRGSLISGSLDYTIKIWEATGHKVAQVEYKEAISKIVLWNDGSLVVVLEKTIRHIRITSKPVGELTWVH